MLKISDEIKCEAQKLNISIELIENSTFAHVMEKINKNFVNHEIRSIFLWEKFNKPEILRDSDGWKYIKEFVKDNQCILFFNKEEDKNALTIKSGLDLDKILAETFGFEFYITNKNVDYVICFNHHDCLSGCGLAKKWIADIH